MMEQGVFQYQKISGLEDACNYLTKHLRILLSFAFSSINITEVL